MQGVAYDDAMKHVAVLIGITLFHNCTSLDAWDLY
jgi:hypothetical protein